METKRWVVYVIAILIFGFSTSYSIAESLHIISPRFTVASDVTPANSDIMEPGKSALGFDGTNYLLVSCRADISPPKIFGVLVSTKGLVLNTFPIAELNPVYGCTNQRPAVAFDGTNYLVVYSRVTEINSISEIAGTLISPAGVVINGSEQFAIISDVSDNPVVAYDGSNYLVVTGKYSNDTLHDIYGARVNTSGQVLGELLIFSAPGGQVMPSIAFDGTNYFVIWSDTRSGSPVGQDADIYGTRISPAGTVLNPEGIPISTAIGPQSWPQIIFDGENYFAVWEDTRNDPEAFPPVIDIFGTRITQEGVVLDGSTETGGIAINTHPLPQQHPRVSFYGTQYFVAWDMSFFYDPPVGIYGVRVSTEGLLIDGPPESGGILISQPSSYASKFVWPNILSSDKTLFLSWINNSEVYGEGKDILGVLINPNVAKIDFNEDGIADVADAIILLKLVTNISQEYKVDRSSDINGDNKIGLEDIIFVLQMISELRE